LDGTRGRGEVVAGGQRVRGGAVGGAADVRHGDVAPSVGQRERDGAPEPARGPGYQGDLALEVHGRLQYSTASTSSSTRAPPRRFPVLRAELAQDAPSLGLDSSASNVSMPRRAWSSPESRT